MSSFAAGLSEHPLATQAVGEVVGQVLDGLGPDAGPPDLALLFVTAPHGGAIEDVAAAVRATLHPGTLLGCVAESVVGGAREVEQGAAISLWAGHTGPVSAIHLRLQRTPDGDTIVGWPEVGNDDSPGLLLLADPFTFPVDAFLGRLGDDRPGLAVIGGLASGANAPGGNRLVLDDQIVSDGAVGVFLGPTVGVATVVSQGCRPVGEPFVVTRSEGNIVHELGGRPALERLQDAARALSGEERQLLSNGLHLGRVIDESKTEFDRGDFLIRNVLGGDPQTGAIAVGDIVEVGSTAQFQVRDAASADEDLRQLIEGRTAQGALLFTCNGRGTRLFGRPDHDAQVVAEGLRGAPVAGMFCAGELGPVGKRNFLHGFTASVVLFNAPE
jgi:small ligand-binding sensory domain FIST